MGDDGRRARSRRQLRQADRAASRTRLRSPAPASFSRACSTRPGGIKIATIHAFCQSLLRRFPLEAGVAPHFAVMDERSAAEALAEAAQKVIARRARTGAHPALAEALGIVADHAAEERFAELMGALAQRARQLRRALGRRAWRVARAALHAHRRCARSHRDDACRRRFAPPTPATKPGCAPPLPLLAAGSETDRERGAVDRRMVRAAHAAASAMLRRLSNALLSPRTARSAKHADHEAEPARLGRLRCQGDPRRRGRAAANAARRRGRRSCMREATCALARLGDALLRRL